MSSCATKPTCYGLLGANSRTITNHPLNYCWSLLVDCIIAVAARMETRNAKPGEINKRSWMFMFHVVDSDGHGIPFAFTDNKAHGNP